MSPGYFYEYRQDSSGNINAVIVYVTATDQKSIPVDTTNLEIVLDKGCYPRSGMYSDMPAPEASDLRIQLLQQGCARLLNSTIAPSAEVEAQSSAQKYGIGNWSLLWSTPSPSPSVTETQSPPSTNPGPGLVRRIWNNSITQWLVGGFLSVGTIIAFVKWLYTRTAKQRRALVIFTGDKSAGKTTLRNVFINPELSKYELLNTMPSHTISTERHERVNSKNITLISRIMDMPGGELYQVINELNKYEFHRYRKTVLVIVVSPTRTNVENALQFDFINEQLSTVEKLWCNLIRSDLTKGLSDVVLFINKQDICGGESKTRSYFTQEISELQDACQKSHIRFTEIVGSAVDRVGVQQLLTTAMSRSER